MKITVCIASRGRPAALIGVIMALHRMRSTTNTLDFVLGLDEDDTTTQTVADAFEGELSPIYSVAPQPMVRGCIENRMIGVAAAGEPDVVTLMSDRTFNITPAWDTWIARAAEDVPKRLLWWQCPEDPGCIIPIIPKAYLAANGWTWSPEIFPFWWDDTWHQEVDLMIHGPKSKKARCTYSGARGATAHAREIAFWAGTFAKTRPRRWEQAKKMSAALGVTMPTEVGGLNAYFEQYDRSFVMRAADLEQRFGDTEPPGYNYLTAKTAAQRMFEEQAA